jgi:hypothetical protein
LASIRFSGRVPTVELGFTYPVHHCREVRWSRLSAAGSPISAKLSILDRHGDVGARILGLFDLRRHCARMVHAADLHQSGSQLPALGTDDGHDAVDGGLFILRRAAPRGVRPRRSTVPERIPRSGCGVRAGTLLASSPRRIFRFCFLSFSSFLFCAPLLRPDCAPFRAPFCARAYLASLKTLPIADSY